MRDELRALEGDLVVVSGRLENRRITPDGRWDICLAAVEVRKHTDSQPLQEIEPIRVDHLWIKGFTPEQVDWRGRLRKMVVCGRVNWYRRADGSVDLSVNAVLGMDLDLAFYRIEAEPRLEERLELMLQAEVAIKDGYPVWSWTVCAKEISRSILRAVEKFRENATLTLATHLTATRSGPCERLRSADPFRSAKPGRRKAAGFSSMS